MANGDAAAALGLSTVPGTSDIRLGYDYINALADDLADHVTNGTHPAAKITGTIAVANGGTGATGAAAARTNLGAAATVHTHAWSDITAKPSTFPPSSHTHAYADITAKPSTFPPSSHTHNVDDITGESAWTVGFANGSERVRDHTPAGSGWFAVWVDGNDNFCHNTSSRRYKKNIKNAPIATADVLALVPRVYDRKVPADITGEVGLIAEEVAEHLPWLVNYDADGQPEALRYDLLGVALLPVVQEQAQRIEALEARLVALENLTKAVN